MTVAEALERVEAIRAMHDDESMHAMEDALRAEILAYFAETDPVDLAPSVVRELSRVALTTDGIVFSRWYA